jgi:starch phosphorylase
VRAAETALNEHALTIGFARRFTEYKRPNLILSDPARLTAILTNPERPVQLIASGKAHPNDETGKRLIRQFVDFARRPEVRTHVVFLEDYDISTAQQLVEGVDLWLNTPRRPWEASGTSGMKVLVNGALNISELDGWWAEAYSTEVGWAIGDGEEHAEPGWDQIEAGQLYNLLETEIIPEFYTRDDRGIPTGWVARMRASMSCLALQFSSNRMLREYVEDAYLPAAARYRERTADKGRLARDLFAWRERVRAHWDGIAIEDYTVTRQEGKWRFTVVVRTGGLGPEDIAVELYADALPGEGPLRIRMVSVHTGTGSTVYRAEAPDARPSDHYTPRVLPYHPKAAVPLEDRRILWQK